MPTIEFQLWLKHNGVLARKLNVVKGGTTTISCTNDAEIKMRMSTTVQDLDGIKYATDILVPKIVIDDTIYNIGEFVITGSSRINNGTNSYYEIECFDLTYYLKKYKVETRPFFAAGTYYRVAIAQMLTLGGITNYFISGNLATFRNDREDWEPGTPYIDIVNTLLNEINFNSVYMDLNGLVRCMPYRTPSSENIDYTYENDPYTSILIPGSTINIDAFDHPNVFRYIVDNPEDDTSMIATSVNEDPLNIFSTYNQGRVIEIVKIDNVASQLDLQALADKAITQSQMSKDTLTFSTTIGRPHNPFSIVSVKKNEVSAIIQEKEWTMDISDSYTIRHMGERLSYAFI